MYYIEINNIINKILTIFHRFGFWIIKDESPNLTKTVWKFMYLFVNLSFVMSLLLGGLFSDDWNESVHLIVEGILILVVTVKLTYALWKKKETRAFLQAIGTHSVEDYEEFIKVKEKVKKLMTFSFTFFSLVFAGSASLMTFSLPLFSIFSAEKRLPFNIWFPLDWKKNQFTYWIAFVFVVTSVIISFVASLLTVIIWYLMMNCAIKYQLLGNQFRNMFLTKSTFNRKLFLQELVGLIKTHRNIKETIDRFKSCFEHLFFAQITTSGMGICGSIYALGFGSRNGNLSLMIHSSIILYSIFDIFMIMYLGNEIMLASNRLTYDLFHFKWFEQSKTYKKCLIILTEVLKQPHELEIYKLYPLNMDTFLSIVKTAYSMFNILKNLN